MKKESVPSIIYPTREQKTDITQAAKSQGLSFSAYVIQAAHKQAKKDCKK